MKPNLHPEYKDVKVTCSCGSAFITRSTLGAESLSLEVCSMCHPFYTGTQKIVDAAGRVDRFRQKYGRKTAEKAEETKAEDKPEDTSEEK
jgi:large subunit ribosomal protein L31